MTMMTSIAGVALQCPRCRCGLQSHSPQQLACNSCGTIFPLINEIPSLLPPTLSSEGVNNYFDRVAQGLRVDNLSYVPFDAPQLDRHLRVLSSAYVRAIQRWIPNSSSVLDVGCGHGALLAEAARAYSMIGLDFVYGMLPFARSSGYAAVHGDASALPFADRQFDAVICAEVIQHFPNPTEIINELVRVCKPNGTMIVSTLNRYSLARFMLRALKRGLRPQALPVPILRRTAAQVTSSFAGHPVSLREVAWVLSPSPGVLFSRNANSLFAPLATNFLVCLERNSP